MKVESIFKSRNTLRSDEMTKVSTILKAELEWLAENSGKFPRLKRKTAKEYISDRIKMLEAEEASLIGAKEVLASEVKEEKVKRSRAKKYEVSDYEKGWVFEVPMKDVKIVEGEEDEPYEHK